MYDVLAMYDVLWCVGHIYNIKQTHGLNHNIMLHVLTVINSFCLYVIILTFMVKYNTQDQWFWKRQCPIVSWVVLRFNLIDLIYFIAWLNLSPIAGLAN